jgi:hypothetical protein
VVEAAGGLSKIEKGTFCDVHHRHWLGRRVALPLDLEGLPMKQFIGFAFVAAAIGCAALAQAGIGASKENVVRPKTELAAPAANPNLPFQVLKPLY